MDHDILRLIAAIRSMTLSSYRAFKQSTGLSALSDTPADMNDAIFSVQKMRLLQKRHDEMRRILEEIHAKQRVTPKILSQIEQIVDP